MVPLLAAAMDWIAPGSLPVLGLPALLATAAAVVMTALVARELGGDRRAQVLAAGAFATGLQTNVAAHGWPQWQRGSVVAAESPVLSPGRCCTAVQQVLYVGSQPSALRPPSPRRAWSPTAS